MNQPRLWITASIIGVIVLIGFVLSVPHTHDVGGTPAPTAATSVPNVTVHDVFKKNVHTITGSIQAPDACTTVTANATLNGNASSTQSILIVISMPPDAGICLNLPTAVPFSTTITAPANLPITASVNGVTASTTAS
jgi:hypothetical protein